MEGLDAALERARAAFDAERAQVSARRAATASHDHLRKLAPSGGYAALPKESRKDWRWHARNEPWFASLSFEDQRDHILSITGPRGPDGLPELRAAGFVLLRCFESAGQCVTATKADGTRRDSAAVAFLMEHLPKLDATLRAEAVIRNAAYTIARDYGRQPIRRK